MGDDIFSGEDALKAVSQENGVWNWCFIAGDPEELPLAGGGSGSLDEMRECLAGQSDSSAALYGLLRLRFGTGRLARVKYIFVAATTLDDQPAREAPADTGGAVKSRIGRKSIAGVRPQMQAAFQKYARFSCSLEITSIEDFTFDEIVDRVKRVSTVDGDAINVENLKAAIAEEKAAAQPSEEEAAVDDQEFADLLMEAPSHAEAPDEAAAGELSVDEAAEAAAAAAAAAAEAAAAEAAAAEKAAEEAAAKEKAAAEAAAAEAAAKAAAEEAAAKAAADEAAAAEAAAAKAAAEAAAEKAAAEKAAAEKAAAEKAAAEKAAAEKAEAEKAAAEAAAAAAAAAEAHLADRESQPYAGGGGAEDINPAMQQQKRASQPYAMSEEPGEGDWTEELKAKKAAEAKAAEEAKAAASAAPATAQELANLPKYEVGDLVQVYSDSMNVWYDDGEIIGVMTQAATVNGVSFPAGSYRVRYMNQKRIKCLTPSEAHKSLKRSLRPKPPSPLMGPLEKETHDIFARWHTRFFMVKNGFLQWWTDEMEAKAGMPPKKTLILLGLKLSIKGSIIQVKTAQSKGTIDCFDAGTTDLAAKWAHALRLHSEYASEMKKYHDQKKKESS